MSAITGPEIVGLPKHLRPAVAAKQSKDLWQWSEAAAHPWSYQFPWKIFQSEIFGPESKQLVPSELLAWHVEATPEALAQQIANVVVTTVSRDSCSSKYIVLITKLCLNRLMTAIGSSDWLRKD